MCLEDKSYNRKNFIIRKEDEKLLDINIDYIAINLTKAEKESIKKELDESVKRIKKIIDESIPVMYFEEVEY